MDDRKSDSLLFSLKQLQQIEKDRVDSERAADQARREAEREAAAAAIRAKEEERKRKEAEELERLRQQQQLKQQQLAEKKRRVEEAERRARLEAEMRLTAHGQQIHAQTLQEHKAHTWQKLLGTVIVVVSLICAALGYAIHQNRAEIADAEVTLHKQKQLFASLQTELAQAQERAQSEAKRAKAEAAALKAQIEEEKGKARRKLLIDRLHRKAEAAAAAEKRAAQRKAQQRRALMQNIGKRSKKCSPTDPLCGI